MFFKIIHRFFFTGLNILANNQLALTKVRKCAQHTIDTMVYCLSIPQYIIPTSSPAARQPSWLFMSKIKIKTNKERKSSWLSENEKAELLTKTERNKCKTDTKKKANKRCSLKNNNKRSHLKNI